MTYRTKTRVIRVTGLAVLTALIVVPLLAAETVTRLAVPDPSTGERFGQAADVDGDQLVVSGKGDDAGPGNSGYAAVYTRLGDDWVLQQKVFPVGREAGDRLGESVAIDGGVLLIGAPRQYVSSDRLGAAYIFTRTAGPWEFAQRIPGTFTLGGGRFGTAVDVDGDRAAFTDPQAVFSEGRAYVYVRAGDTWTAERTFAAENPVADDEFGVSVSLDAATIAIGSVPIAAAGYVEVFTRTVATWSHEQTLTAANGGAGDEFGSSVALEGDTLVVGAPFVDTIGAAYVFTRSAGVWTQHAKLVPAGSVAYDDVGGTVALSGNTLLVTAQGDSDDFNDGGSVHVYRGADAIWTYGGRLTAPDASADSFFGSAVAQDGATGVIGAESEDQNGSAAGAAYVLTIDDAPEHGGFLLVETAKVVFLPGLPKRRRPPPGITASGILDIGVAAVDLSAPGVLKIGEMEFPVTDLTPKKKGKFLVHDEPGVHFQLRLPQPGTSKGAFQLSVEGEFPDGPISIGYATGDLDVQCDVALSDGAYQLGKARGTLEEPPFCPSKVSAKFGDTDKDRLKVTTWFSSDGVPPVAPPEVMLSFGDTYVATVPGAAFELKKQTHRFRGKKPGVTKLDVDYRRGRITFAAVNVELGDLPAPSTPVTLRITMGGVEIGSAVLVPLVKGRTLLY